MNTKNNNATPNERTNDVERLFGQRCQLQSLLARVSIDRKQAGCCLFERHSCAQSWRNGVCYVVQSLLLLRVRAQELCQHRRHEPRLPGLRLVALTTVRSMFICRSIDRSMPQQQHTSEPSVFCPCFWRAQLQPHTHDRRAVRPRLTARGETLFPFARSLCLVREQRLRCDPFVVERAAVALCARFNNESTPSRSSSAASIRNRVSTRRLICCLKNVALWHN